MAGASPENDQFHVRPCCDPNASAGKNSDVSTYTRLVWPRLCFISSRAWPEIEVCYKLERLLGEAPGDGDGDALCRDERHGEHARDWESATLLPLAEESARSRKSQTLAQLKSSLSCQHCLAMSSSSSSSSSSRVATCRARSSTTVTSSTSLRASRWSFCWRVAASSASRKTSSCCRLISCACFRSRRDRCSATFFSKSAARRTAKATCTDEASSPSLVRSRVGRSWTRPENRTGAPLR
mmetsp:Transcript_3022/g.7692  ORF Transcript_3022/g.7692 Transcript_3022/m.7692 type:complete len:239 (+) Transcript_3022:151-867(+)